MASVMAMSHPHNAAMASTSTSTNPTTMPGPRKIRRRNQSHNPHAQAQARPAPIVRPSLSIRTDAAAPQTTTTPPASRFKPMTIRVVTSEDERSESASGSEDTNTDSESDHSSVLDLDLDLEFNDDDVFMPVIQAATMVPVKTQRAHSVRKNQGKGKRKSMSTSMSKNSRRAAATTTSTTTSPQEDSFPPALVAFLQDDTDLWDAQFADFLRGNSSLKTLVDTVNNDTTTSSTLTSVPASAPPRYPFPPGSGPPRTSPPARLPASTSTTSSEMANSAYGGIAGLLHNDPRRNINVNMNMNMGAPVARHALVESYVPAPLRIEKKTKLQLQQPQQVQYNTPTPPQQFQSQQQSQQQTQQQQPQQSTEDFVRRTDRSMARQQQMQAEQQRAMQLREVQQREQRQQEEAKRQQQQQAQQEAAAAQAAAQQAQYAQQQAQHQQYVQQQIHLQQLRQRRPSNASNMSAVSQNSQFSQHSHNSQNSHASQITHSSFGGPSHPPQLRGGAPFQWQRPAPIKPAKPVRRRAPGEMFAALPGEVLELILDELKKLHMEDANKGQGCATCWMRDAGAMAVSARKMLKYARVALYEGIELVGADAVHARHQPKTKKLKSQKEQAAQQAALLANSRLALLLRTLRGSPQIAVIVRTLKVPPTFSSPLLTAPVSPDEYESLVASVVSACPNLERVVGYYPAYDHATHSRYSQALASRTRLKETNWILAPLLSQEQLEQQAREQREQELLALQQQQKQRSRAKSFSHMMRPQSPPSPPTSPRLVDDEFGVRPRTGSAAGLPGAGVSSTAVALSPRHSARFLNHHIHWQYLSTLTVHCQPGATLTPATLLVDALMYLPALQNLYLSHMPAAAFDDSSLLALPPLKKLSLVHCPGPTSEGLSTFATRGTSRSLTDLSLIHVGLDSLPALARILSKLDRLVSFTLVQPQAPALPSGEVIWLFPYLASPSLKKLHWDVPVPAASNASAASTTFSPFGSVLPADVVLSRSIAAEGFPALRQLRTPCDPEGLFQALCRPQERVDLPRDRYRAMGTTYPAAFTAPQTQTTSSPPSAGHRHRYSESSVFSASFGSHSRTNSSASLGLGKGSAASSPSSTSSSSSASSASSASASGDWECSHLGVSRVAAQGRIDASRRAPRVFVNVTDEHGRLVDKYGLAGFVGTVGSQITYHLLPDVGASDEKGGLVDMQDFVGETDTASPAKLGDKNEKSTSSADASPTGVICNGQWNANWEVPQKKDRERWWHAERGMAKAVKLI